MSADPERELYDEALISKCQRCISGYQKVKRSVTQSTHLEEFLKTNGLTEDSAKSKAIENVFFGCERHRKVIKLAVDGLYSHEKANILRNDRVLYEVFVYLSIFKFSGVFIDQYQYAILQQSPHKMLMLLKFMFSKDIIDDWLADQFSLVYDYTFVENELIASMHEYDDQIESLIQQLESSQELAATTGRPGSGSTTNSTRRRTTVPKPFHLTQPKPRIIPEPTVKIKRDYKSRPAPKSLHERTLEDLERERQQRRDVILKQTLQKHETFKAPQLSRPKSRKSRSLPPDSKPDKFKAKPLPKYPEPPEVKVTAASILREEALFRKRQEKEAEALKRFEAELKDSAEFDEWQENMLSQDDLKRSEAIQQRKQDMMLSQERAVAAMKEVAEENRLRALEQRRQAETELKHKQEQEQIAAEEARRKARDFATQQAENVEQAKKQNLSVKRKIYKSAQEAKQQRREAIEKRRQDELKERQELIRQIQAMERVASAMGKRPKEFDPTSTCEYGLMNEMSMVELHERLSLMKLREEDRLQRKRKDIVQQKAEQVQMLQAKMRNIARLRKAAYEGGSARRAERRSAERSKAEADRRAQGQQAIKAVERIEEKKTAKLNDALQLAKEIREARIKQQFVNSDKSQIDQMKWKNMHAGAEKRSQKQQAAKQQAAIRQQALLSKATRQQTINRRAQQREQKRKQAAYAKKVERLREEVNEFESAEDSIKRQQALTVKQAHKAQHDKAQTLNPYAALVGQRNSQRRNKQIRHRKQLMADLVQGT